MQGNPQAMAAHWKSTRSMRCLRCNSRKHLAANHPHVKNEDSDSEEERKLGTPKDWGEVQRKMKKQQARIADLEEEVAQFAQENPLVTEDTESDHGFLNVQW